jgi:hypothetical protein
MSGGSGRAERAAGVLGARPAQIGRYLLALLGAPVLWTAHLLVGYFLVALACTTGWADGVDPLLIASTVALGAASAWCGLYAWRGWRERRTPLGLAGEVNGPPSASALLYLMGALAGVVFTLAIVWEGLPPLFVPTCQWGSP